MHKSNRKKIEEKGIQRKKEGKREQEVSLDLYQKEGV